MWNHFDPLYFSTKVKELTQSSFHTNHKYFSQTKKWIEQGMVAMEQKSNKINANTIQLPIDRTILS